MDNSDNPPDQSQQTGSQEHIDKHHDQQSEFGEMDPAGVGPGDDGLDMEQMDMNMNIKQALQRVIEGFDHGTGDISATLQQQEEYIRRNVREQEDHAGVSAERHDDNIFEHFPSMDVGSSHMQEHEHLSRAPSHHSSHTPQAQDHVGASLDAEGNLVADSDNQQQQGSDKGTKRKRTSRPKGPIPPIPDDPTRPLTEDEIRRKQNRSRASGRVLAVSDPVLCVAVDRA